MQVILVVIIIVVVVNTKRRECVRNQNSNSMAVFDHAKILM